MSEPLDSVTDPWELLEELGPHRRMRVRAANYSRFIALAANQPTAQQQMLTYEAHRVFHMQQQIIRRDLERSRLLAQLELRSATVSRFAGGAPEAEAGSPVSRTWFSTGRQRGPASDGYRSHVATKLSEDIR